MARLGRGYYSGCPGRALVRFNFKFKSSSWWAGLPSRLELWSLAGRHWQVTVAAARVHVHTGAREGRCTGTNFRPRVPPGVRTAHGTVTALAGARTVP